MTAALSLRGLTLAYEGQNLFQDFCFDLPEGEISILLGASGCGKTTLLRAIAGLEPVSEGSITTAAGGDVQPHLAYMGQSDLLFPWCSVIENTVIGSTLRGEAPDYTRARALLDEVGLSHVYHSKPNQLSGGMRQRAALARTLYEGRPIVLMDEPFSALDSLTRFQVQNLAATHLQGKSVLLVTHDPMEACRLGHNIFILQQSPARIAPFDLALRSAPPRAPSDPELLEHQARLLATLLEGMAT